MSKTLIASEFVLPLADPEATLDMVGGKGASLARLVTAGLPVPDGFHVTTAAYHRFVTENDLQFAIQAAIDLADINQASTLVAASVKIRELFAAGQIPPEVAGAIAQEYAELAGRDPTVAVRSSATAEDLPEASFAGQQETYLNVLGVSNVLEAVKRCWASLWTARAIAYRARQGVGTEGLGLAVVVQTLVPAEAAGILFTVNPVTGNRDQAIISAAWGLGEAVVGGLVTPDAYTVDKASGMVLERQIADKQVMTVRVNGGTQEQPVLEALRRAPVLDHEAANELVQLGVQIENLYGMPMDIEWALADGRFFIVQARPVTGLPEVPVSPPEEWELPEPKGRYMRTSVIDFMPDPLSPLFATMGVSAYNQCIQQMFVEITDSKRRIFPEDLIVMINDYAYYKVSFSAREWWAMLSKLGPRLIKFIRNGPSHFRDVAMPEYRAKVESLSQQSATEMTNAQIWSDAHKLISAAMYHMSFLQVDTLGAAAGSEGLFTATYNRFINQGDVPKAAAYVMGYNSMPIRSEKSLYSLAQWTCEKPTLSEYILNTEAEKIAEASFSDTSSSAEVPPGVVGPVWNEWKHRLNDHLNSFGHILYDLDFSRSIPAEDPAPQIVTLKMYMRGQGVNPHERQAQLEQKREQATTELLEHAGGLRGWVVRKALGWAQSLAAVREDSIASIGLAYPRLRQLLLELGRRLAATGAIQSPEDIFWLEEAEINDHLEALEIGEQLDSQQEIVQQRRKIRQAERKVIPPTQLPYSKTYMGVPVEVFIPGEGGKEGNRLKGAPASGGRVTGVACVIHGPEDFDQMQQGGILVARLTTPAWTPLFAMAGGVVTDVGGPLSHGSIVAREYGIPAVLGTLVATQHIRSGQRIIVDGDAGVVTLEG